MNKTIAIILAGVVWNTSAFAQFFTPMERSVWYSIFQRSDKKVRGPKEELPWVTLVKEAEKIPPNLVSVEFKQEPVPPEKGFLFQKRKFSIQEGIFCNAILRGYEVIVPRPTDLTSLYQNDVTNIKMFFEQGTTFEKVHATCKNQSARKYREGMVEIRFQPLDSENTFIFLIDVPHTRIYIFLNKYKNKI